MPGHWAVPEVQLQELMSVITERKFLIAISYVGSIMTTTGVTICLIQSNTSALLLYMRRKLDDVDQYVTCDHLFSIHRHVLT